MVYYHVKSGCYRAYKSGDKAINISHVTYLWWHYHPLLGKISAYCHCQFWLWQPLRTEKINRSLLLICLISMSVDYCPLPWMIFYRKDSKKMSAILISLSRLHKVEETNKVLWLKNVWEIISHFPRVLAKVWTYPKYTILQEQNF